MLKSLASLFKNKGDAASALIPGAVPEEEAPIYMELAMTDEMREALFPTTPRMVSAIFERPAAAKGPKLPLPPPETDPLFQRPMARETGQFPIV
jgi:hypothetical protein